MTEAVYVHVIVMVYIACADLLYMYVAPCDRLPIPGHSIFDFRDAPSVRPHRNLDTPSVPLPDVRLCLASLLGIDSPLSHARIPRD